MPVTPLTYAPCYAPGGVWTGGCRVLVLGPRRWLEDLPIFVPLGIDPPMVVFLC